MKFEEIGYEGIFVKTFQDDIRNYLKDKHIFLIGEKKKEVFVLSNELYNTYLKLRRKPYNMGFYIGEIKDNFKIGLEFGEILSKLVNHHRVWVKEELYFLKGFNLKQKHILKIDNKVYLGDYLLVLNENNEYLGIGRLRKNNPLKIENIIDKGWYVRQSIKKEPRKNPRRAKQIKPKRSIRRKKKVQPRYMYKSKRTKF